MKDISSARFALILPACEEEECIVPVIEEIRRAAPGEEFVIAVGVNGSRDKTAELSRDAGVIVGETEKRGYGHGCLAAIEALPCPRIEAYIFMAADGANDPHEISKLVSRFREGVSFVLGNRTTTPANQSVMGAPHVLANVVLGLWTSLLTRRLFLDIGPFRLIERELFHAMNMRELTFGWTIEAQIRAVQLGATVVEIPVTERPRLAGHQKVSRVSWRQTLRIGAAIFAAGWRTRRRQFPASTS